MHKHDQTICVLGLGYIGLPTAAIFASRGLQVVGVDTNPKVVSSIQDGSFHYVEPDLDMLVQASIGSRKLKVQATPTKADVFMLAVPTPVSHNHEADLSNLHAALASIAPFLQKGSLIIIESTVPVGTTEALSVQLAILRPDLRFPQSKTQGQEQKQKKANSNSGLPMEDQELDVHIAFCPERVLPGKILKELVENDRIIGGITPRCGQVAKECYSIFVQGEIKLSDSRVAEMCKLAENAFRDVNIAFANELSMAADTLNININELITLANCHPRVNILQPGSGVGGHCIAVDPWFLINATPQESHLMRTARQVNLNKTQWVLDKAIKAVEQIEKNRSAQTKQPIQEEVKQNQQGNQAIQIACLGIAYKSDVDDLRESPALAIVESLASNKNLAITVVEPNIKALPSSLQEKKVNLMPLDAAIQQSDLVLILVDHSEFKNHNYTPIGTQLLIDTKGIWI
jgi:UDP-N-acetyl-D-mannosaminuronic acid dehydrogenase